MVEQPVLAALSISMPSLAQAPSIEGSYRLAPRTLTSPVKMQGQAVQFKFPFEVPTLTFEGDKATATSPSGLRAVWEKIE